MEFNSLDELNEEDIKEIYDSIMEGDMTADGTTGSLACRCIQKNNVRDYGCYWYATVRGNNRIIYTICPRLGSGQSYYWDTYCYAVVHAINASEC